ncbi:MAG: amidohydrolase family protein [Actinomycetota bacterium]|nr:amidohydrolase family protein [Actinomycetota bacterium]
MILLSIDDHMIEPPDMFDNHMPAALKDKAPKLTKIDGKDHWIFQGESIGVPGLAAVASWPKSEWGFDPTDLSEMRPGCYDVDERVKDMDANGMLAGMNFPTFAGFAGTHLAKMPDKALTNAAISAYNDWAIDDVAGSHPGRFIPLSILPIFDIDAAVKEVHRVAAKGCKAISMPETPYGVGLPSFASGHWDPVFAAMLDTGMTPCMHIGGGFGLVKRPAEAIMDDLIILAPQVMAITVTDIILGGLLQRFPTLKFALSEGGIGWVSFFLDRMDRHVTNQSWTHLDKLPAGKTPTEAWKEHFLACFITDPSALHLRDRIGVNTLAWECDYPHSDCTWPNSPELLMQELNAAKCSDADIDAITWKNVANFFDYDPFQYIKKEDATVGALRAKAKAAGVDVSETSKVEYKRRFEAALVAGN